MTRFILPCILLIVLIVIGITLYSINTREFIETLPKPPEAVLQEGNGGKAVQDSIGGTPAEEGDDASLSVSHVDDENEIDDTSDMSETPAEGYDWRHENHHGQAHTHEADPWEQIDNSYSFSEIMEGIKKDGYYIDDQGRIYTRTPPEEVAPETQLLLQKEAFLKRFGDIPEVHIFFEAKRKRLNKIPLTLEEDIANLSAMNTLFPHPKTQAALERLRELKKRGARYSMRYH